MPFKGLPNIFSIPIGAEPDEAYVQVGIDPEATGRGRTPHARPSDVWALAPSASLLRETNLSGWPLRLKLI